MDPALPTAPPGHDASPSLAGTANDVWLAWFRQPDASTPTPSLIMVGRGADISGTLTYTAHATQAAVSAVGVSHDDHEPFVFYATVPEPLTGVVGDIFAWRPGTAAAMVLPIMHPLDRMVTNMSVAQIGNAAHFDVGIVTVEPRVEDIEVLPAAGYASFTTVSNDFSNSVGVAVARAFLTDIARFAVLGPPSDVPRQLVITDRGNSSSSTVDFPNQPASVAITHTPAGPFRVAVVTDGSSLAEMDVPLTSTMPTPSVARHLPVTTLSEVALAPDHVTATAWTFGLTAANELVVGTETDTMATILPVPSTYTMCQHLQAASVAAFPDFAFVTMSCVFNFTVRHVLFLVIERVRPLPADAGADSGPETDAATDATDVIATPDAAGPDGSVGMDVSAADQGPTSGTGPAFRGGACACRTMPSSSRTHVLGIALAVVVVMARRRR